MRKIILILGGVIALFLVVFLYLLKINGGKMDTTQKYNQLQSDNSLEVATLAGGCFWGVEAKLDNLSGVIEAFSGYSGGEVKNPSYKQVSSGKTGHKEAVQVFFDPQKITYQELLTEFFDQIDPTDAGGQLANRGSQYQTAVFYHNEKQKQVAQNLLDEITTSGKYNKPIATQVLPYENFYLAENYHQDYFLKQRLTSLQYKVTQKGGTEPTFRNKY